MSEIRQYLNDAQRQVFNHHMLPQLEKVFKGALTVGEYSYEHQVDHQTTIRLKIKDPDTGITYDISDNYTSYKDFDLAYPDPGYNQNATPWVWTDRPGGPLSKRRQLYFSHPVDKLYEMSMTYIASVPELVNDTDVPTVPEEFGELLILGAARRVFQAKDMEGKADDMDNEYKDLLEDYVMRYSTKQVIRPHIMRVGRMRGY